KAAKAQEQKQEETSFHKSGKLLPFLSAKAENHQSRIETLDSKIAVQQDKINSHKSAIQRLSDKADRLEDRNRILKATFGENSLVRKFIEKNEQKIADIRENKIPARKQKINVCEAKIEKHTAKRDRFSHKLNRVLALNDAIRSFSIGISKERREAFADAMSRLTKANEECLTDKKNILLFRKDSLIAEYNKPETSIVDRRGIQDKINSLSKRIMQLDTKITELTRSSFYYKEQTDEQLDASIKITGDKLGDIAQSENITVPAVSEEAVRASHEVEYLDKPKIAELAAQLEDQAMKNTEMMLEDDYNMIDGIINNGSKAEKDDTGIEYIDEGYKINADYYFELPPEKRHYESMTEEQGFAVMEALTDAGVEFSAISRGSDRVNITVANEDVPKLNDIMYSTIGKVAKTAALDENSKKKSEYGIFKTVNPEYYASLPKDQCYTHTNPTATAEEIEKQLISRKIPYSAVFRKNDIVAVTVSMQNKTVYDQIERSVRSERVKGLHRTAPDKPVQKPERKAEVSRTGGRRAFFSRDRMKQSAQRISSKGQQKPPQQSKGKNQGLE
ncbi:MAG: DUF4316 domain-containing protein, partial [Oscillospiraceae bacterium]|nr:DUF4316 domain-containing protein [Oscillospiraceae bacterium]